MKDTIYTELWYRNRLEMKILKWHHYVVDFTEKKPRNLQGIRQNQILEKKTPTKQIYLSLFIHLLYFICYAYSLYELQGKKYQSVGLEQYFIDKICNILCATERTPWKSSHCIKPLKEITFRHILTEWQQTLFRIKICEKAG